jgi:hypothetical protein
MNNFRITLEPAAEARPELIKLFEELSTYNNYLTHYPENKREQMMYDRVRDLLIQHNKLAVVPADFLNYGRGQYHFWIAGLYNGLQNERFILIEIPKNH